MASVKFKKSLTKAQYDVLSAGEKEASALYFLGGDAENPNTEDVKLILNGKDYSGVKKIETGSAAGTIKVDGVDVAVKNAITDTSGKADKVTSATEGNFAGLDANGNLTDSGKKAADFATSTQGGKADTAVQSVKITGSDTELKSGTNVVLPAYPTKTTLELNNVTNDAQVRRSEMGVANGVATLGNDGKVPSTQLPSYVDDVVEGYYKSADGKFYESKNGDTYSTEITGETGKIYVDLGNGNKTYRFGGSAFAEIIASPGTTDAITEGSTHLFYTDERAKSVVDTEIAKLDASESQTAGADGLALSVTEVDGKITSISGSIAANTYDAHGAAATAKSDVIGASGDASSANTVYGAKKKAEEEAAAVVGNSGDTASANTVYGAKAYADSAISGLDATASQTAAAANGQLSLSITEADGKITAISGSITANTYDAYGSAAAVAAMLEWD